MMVHDVFCSFVSSFFSPTTPTSSSSGLAKIKDHHNSSSEPPNKPLIYISYHTIERNPKEQTREMTASDVEPQSIVHQVVRTGKLVRKVSGNGLSVMKRIGSGGSLSRRDSGGSLSLRRPPRRSSSSASVSSKASITHRLGALLTKKQGSGHSRLSLSKRRNAEFDNGDESELLKSPDAGPVPTVIFQSTESTQTSSDQGDDVSASVSAVEGSDGEFYEEPLKTDDIGEETTISLAPPAAVVSSVARVDMTGAPVSSAGARSRSGVSSVDSTNTGSNGNERMIAPPPPNPLDDAGDDELAAAQNALNMVRMAAAASAQRRGSSVISHVSMSSTGSGGSGGKHRMLGPPPSNPFDDAEENDQDRKTVGGPAQRRASSVMSRSSTGSSGSGGKHRNLLPPPSNPLDEGIDDLEDLVGKDPNAKSTLDNKPTEVNVEEGQANVYRTITQNDIFGACFGLNSGTSVVHFFGENCDTSNSIDTQLEIFCARQTTTNFFRINGRLALFVIKKFRVRKFPSVVVIEDGEVLDVLEQFDDDNPSLLQDWLEKTAGVVFEY